MLARRLACACALTLLAPAAASADVGFAPTHTIPVGAGMPGAQDVAVADTGAATVAYLHGTSIRTASREPGGDFADPQTIGTGLIAPRVAVEDDGTAIVVFVEAGELKWVVRAPGGDFGSATTLGTAATEPFDLVRTPTGATAVAWKSGNDVKVAEKPEGEAFGAPQTAFAGATESVAGFGSPVAVAAGTGGRLLVAFATSEFNAPVMGQTTKRLRTAMRSSADTSFASAELVESAVEMIAMGFTTFTPADAAYRPDGDVDLLYLRRDEPMPGFAMPTPTGLKATHRNSSGWVTPAATLDTASFNFMPAMPSSSLSDPSLVPDRDGSTTAVWALRSTIAGLPPTTSALRRARRGTTDGALSLIAPLADLTDPVAELASPRFAELPDGRYVATWNRAGQARGAILPDASATLGAGEALGSAVSSTALGTSPEGAIALAWSALDGADGLLRVALLDAAAPVISTLSVPEKATVGDSVAMAASATDDSGVSGLAWDFGDGGTATGGQVSHVFTKAGTFTVALTATDARGLSAKRTRAITVAAAPAAPAAPRPAAAARDLLAPTLSSLKLSRSTFAVASGATALTAAAGKGTVLTYRANEAARVAVGVERITRGYRSGKKCVSKKPKAKKGKKLRRCDLVKTRGTLTRSAVAGPNRLAFTGRLGRKALPRGKYRFALVAVDAAGNRSKPTRVAFTVVKK